MTALTKQETREVARPLPVLEKLILEQISAGDTAGMDYYRKAGDMLNEAKYGHFDGDVSGFWRWAEKKFGKTRTGLRTWMALSAHEDPKQFKTLTEVHQKVLKQPSTMHGVVRRPYMAAVDAVADRARDEARRLAAEEELTRKQERDAEAKLGLRLIDIGFKILARELHPDKGGSREAMQRLSRVRDRLKANV